MANTMQVSLDTTKTPYRLSVDDHGGQNQVSANSNGPTTITWNLTGQLAQGNFVAMTDPNPGFSWIDNTSSGIFDKPSIGASGNSLSIVDHHLSSTSNGTWVYMLRVNYNGTVYTTTNIIVGPGGTVNNPVIVNH
jgi:hypothetical protein